MKSKTTYISLAIILALLANLLPITGQAIAFNTGSMTKAQTTNGLKISAGPSLSLPPKRVPRKQPPLYGVEMVNVSEGSVLDLAEQASVHWVRRNAVKWNEIEAIEGVRDWSQMADLENEMVLLSQKGMDLILIVRGVPEWARTPDGYVCGPIAEKKFKAFAGFMRELVRRYSQPPFNVHYWELGNEPDVPTNPNSTLFGCWGNPDDPYYGGGNYGKMLKVVYPKIKAADRNAQVLIGGLLMDCDPNNPPIVNGVAKDCSSSKFLEGILRVKAGDYFDGVSYHSYDYYYESLGMYGNANWGGLSTTTGPILDAKADFIKSTLAKYRARNKFIMNTETALLCNDQTQLCDATFETTQAYYVVHSYVEALKSDLSASIWYSLTDNWRDCNLISGSTPKPAYYAYQTFSSILGQANFVGQMDSYPGLAVYEFIQKSKHGDRQDDKQDGKRVWVIWSLDGTPQLLSLPNQPSQAWNVFGEPLTPSTTIEVGLEPLYLEW